MITAPLNRMIAANLGLVIFVALVALIGTQLGASIERTLTIFLISLTAIAAIGLYSGNSGVLSFGHLAFMGIGAYAAALLTLPANIKGATLPALPAWLAGLELSLWPAALLAVLLTVVIAALIGIAIWRLDGSTAAVATLSLLIIVHGVLIGWRDVTRGAQTFFGVPRETTIWAAALGCLVTLIIVRLYRDSRNGLRLRAGRENAAAAAAIGIDVPKERFFAFVLSAGLVALSGALIAHFLGAFSPKKFYFADTFFLLAMLITGGMTTVTGAVAGAAAVTLVTEVLRRLESGVDLGFIQLPQVFGTTQIGIALLILIALMRRPEGLAGFYEWEERLLRPKRQTPPAVALDPGQGGVLEGRDLTMRFGGVTALDQVSLEVRPGEILGLIGPNGSGKTTLLNLLSGMLQPSAGRITRDDQDLTNLAQHRFVSQGIARTFQNIRLFPTLSVYQNVQAAAVSSGEAAHAEARVQAALARLGIGHLADQPAGNLSYGDQRRLEIARAVVCEPSLLFLDEPAAGMNREETDALMATLRSLNEDVGIGILLVDHDLNLINALCHRIIVLNEGRTIAEGRPDEIRTHPAVIEAYTGSANTNQPPERGEKQ
ncbi:MAG: branched-chain amino acid ABC transporter ATP-binding protein/permease [Geminicoccaceae bacterium]